MENETSTPPFSGTSSPTRFAPWPSIIPTVTALARIIYDERAFDQMPEVADALEASGCTDDELLAHCRIGNHVRGCWVVDLVLGKE